MQNLVVLMEPSEDAWDNSLKAGNMILNRFCIDESAAFELCSVVYLKKSPRYVFRDENREFGINLRLQEKGKKYSFLRYFLK